MSQHGYNSRGRDDASTRCGPCPSPGYVLAWSTKHSLAQLHRHILSGVQELRAELLASEAIAGPSRGRMLVLRTAHMGDDVREALVNLARVDGGFVDAHVAGRPYRPRGRRRRPCWSCKYPEVAVSGDQVPLYRPGDGQMLTISRLSVWLGAGMPIVIVGHGAGAGASSKPRPRSRRRRHHRGAAAGYGAIGYAFPSSTRCVDMSSFEEDLWTALTLLAGNTEGPDGVPVPVEELLGELVYDRWASCLSAMRLGMGSPGQEQQSLWGAMDALESNLDEARYLSGRGEQLDAPWASAWGDLMRRLEMRVRLCQPSISGVDVCRGQASLARGGKTDNDRSLDRIAYLGGLTLPVSAVASILAIEGDYGPVGERFWVFWLLSFLASVLALLVIYADQLRTVEVWFEIGDMDDEDLPGEGEGDDDDGWDAARYLVQRWTDGSKSGTWKRSELGWGGAMKKMSGYYWWRRDPRLAFRRPGEVLRPRGV